MEADIAPVLDSGLRRNDEIELLNCLIIKCQHCLVIDRAILNGDTRLLVVLMGRLNRKFTSLMFAKQEELTSFTSDRLNINGFILVNGLGYDKKVDSNWFADET